MLLYGIGYSDLINPKIIYSRKRVTAFVIDKTKIQIGGRNEAWLWIAIEPVRSTVLGVYLSRHRNMLVAESFLRSSIEISSSDFKQGDEVYGQAGVTNGGSGAFAEIALAKTDSIANKPKRLSHIEAAALPLVGVSAWRALTENIGLSKGQRILIHGGARGIGSISDRTNPCSSVSMLL